MKQGNKTLYKCMFISERGVCTHMTESEYTEQINKVWEAYKEEVERDTPFKCAAILSQHVFYDTGEPEVRVLNWIGVDKFYIEWIKRQNKYDE